MVGKENGSGVKGGGRAASAAGPSLPPSVARSTETARLHTHGMTRRRRMEDRWSGRTRAHPHTDGGRTEGGTAPRDGQKSCCTRRGSERASTIDKGDAKHTRGCSAQLSGITKEGRRALRDRPPPCHPTFLRSEKMRCQIEGFAVKRSLLESRRDLHVRRTTKLPATGDGFLFSPWFGQPRPKCSHVTGGCSDSGITSFLKRQVGAGLVEE